MPIYSWTEHDLNSCEAACLVVAVAELQELPAPVADLWMTVTELRLPWY